MNITESFSKSSGAVGTLFDVRSPRYGIVSMRYPISDKIESNKFERVEFGNVGAVSRYAVNKKAFDEYCRRFASDER